MLARNKTDPNPKFFYVYFYVGIPIGIITFPFPLERDFPFSRQSWRLGTLKSGVEPQLGHDFF